MKLTKIFSVLVCSIFAVSLYAAEEQAAEPAVKKEDVKVEEKKTNEPTSLYSLFPSGRPHLSGYGAPVVRLSKFRDDYRTMIGARGGLIINDKFVIGGAGYAIAGTFSKNIEDVNRDVFLGYGGLLLEYYFFPKSLIHISLGTLIGGGGAEYSTGTREWIDHHGHTEREDTYKGGSFFIVEPEINLFINITKFARIGIGGTYRFPVGLNRRGLNNNDINGFSGSIMFAFGWF